MPCSFYSQIRLLAIPLAHNLTDTQFSNSPSLRGDCFVVAPLLLAMTYLLCPSHRPTKRRFAAFELPREDAERDAFVVQFFESNIAAEIFNVHTIMREQGVVR